ncbi:hypothetical protein PoB_000747800 [Plakobranchus ocellatus]|uniref:Integrase catalytic domain-containing protein n=1 Tax=Plakobranchus ocellatus TaxID=259542 RepID=A0AAV3YES4_9GAST|nr:hypothetical protein PoB_000747800 [Plakobranchus ocellatus]
MCLQGESSFFWLGMTSAIINLRTRCIPCNRMAPSQPSAPPTPPIQPTYPFQCICADFFTYADHNYLVIAIDIVTGRLLREQQMVHKV